MPASSCKKLVEKYGRRLEAVLQYEGYATKYWINVLNTLHRGIYHYCKYSRFGNSTFKFYFVYIWAMFVRMYMLKFHSQPTFIIWETKYKPMYQILLLPTVYRISSVYAFILYRECINYRKVRSLRNIIMRT